MKTTTSNTQIPAPKHTYTYAEIRNMFKKLNKQEITTSAWWAFLDDVKAAGCRDTLVDVTTNYRMAQERLQDYINSPLFRNKIRKYCNRVAGGDSYPYQVVKVLSKSRVLIRYMDARYNKVNGKYEYAMMTDDNAAFEIKLTKKGWGSGQYVMSDAPCYKQDPSF